MSDVIINKIENGFTVYNGSSCKTEFVKTVDEVLDYVKRITEVL